MFYFILFRITTIVHYMLSQKYYHRSFSQNYYHMSLSVPQVIRSLGYLIIIIIPGLLKIQSAIDIPFKCGSIYYFRNVFKYQLWSMYQNRRKLPCYQVVCRLWRCSLRALCKSSQRQQDFNGPSCHRHWRHINLSWWRTDNTGKMFKTSWLYYGLFL